MVEKSNKSELSKRKGIVLQRQMCIGGKLVGVTRGGGQSDETI